MSDDRTLAQLYVMALARELRDGDRLHVGANQPEVMLAAAVARRTWAPRLRVIGAGTAFLRRGGELAAVGRRTYDRSLIETRDATFHQSRVFDDLRRAPICFAGGMQVDRRGNANLIGIADGDRFVLRGPGSAGLPTLTSYAPRFYIGCPAHSPRVLVESVSRVSVAGDPAARRAAGLDPGALAAVITPLARFEHGPDGLELVEHAPGVGVQEIAAQTGFEVRASARLAERPGVTDQEAAALSALREADR
jgi:glutaconate CoA-transferase subunit B